jgi:tetratricopeptide (TPR) repeat protein
MAIVFVIAFVVRLVYLIQISHAPYFERPSGDAKVFFDRSGEILQGNFFGDEIYFYSSPPYPYFLALVFWFFGNNFFMLGLIQIFIGSINCLLIFLLTKKLARGRIVPSFIGGLFAALYGLFAFFDASLLMIFLTLIFVNITLLLLIEYKESKKPMVALWAGIALGCAALDRMNILLFVPVAAWFVAGTFSFSTKKWRWKPALLLIGGTIAMIVPVTIRNYIVGKDFVPVASNAGVNFYIGNNPQALGVFYIPPESGLSNYDLPGTAVDVAEDETGRELKPSEVSQFWMKKASTFIVSEPVQEIQLLGRKFLLFWNAYEIPNNLNFYFVRREFGPVLYVMFLGFWLIAPIAVFGIVWRWRKGFTPIDKLLVGFVIIYMVSVIPFFITERYRLPIVPALIAFASVTIVDTYHRVKAGKLRDILFLGLGCALVGTFVNWPIIHANYRYTRTIVGIRYLDRAMENPEFFSRDIKKAILQLKWAVELEPADPFARFRLGRAYASVGFYSGAIYEWETMLKIDPGNTLVQEPLDVVRARFKAKGSTVPGDVLPKTPYEEALVLQANKHYASAIKKYREVIEEEPFHFQAYHNAAILLFERGRHHEAIELVNRGVSIIPNNVVLLYDLGMLYYRTGEVDRARQLWERCLDVKPDCQPALDALQLFTR